MISGFFQVKITEYLIIQLMKLLNIFVSTSVIISEKKERKEMIKSKICAIKIRQSNQILKILTLHLSCTANLLFLKRLIYLSVHCMAVTPGTKVGSCSLAL